MSLVDAVISIGEPPPDDATRAQKKRYSELLSHHLAVEVAEGLCACGLSHVKPIRGGPREKEFRGGLGTKKVDVSYSDEQHGLVLAVSIKSINFSPYGKNLKNRFSDLCTEAITLHMRFPYSVICALFVLPVASDEDLTERRTVSTFQSARELFATIAGRRDYADPAEKFENITLMRYHPFTKGKQMPKIGLINAETGDEMSEEEYFQMVRELYNARNPHAPIGD